MAQTEPTTGFVANIYEPSTRAETAAMLAKLIELREASGSRSRAALLRQI